MDDKRFDDIIKSKLEGLEGESYDPSALAGLHHKMAQTGVRGPWYQVYRNELLAAAAVLVICLFNAGLFGYMSKGGEGSEIEKGSTQFSEQPEVYRDTVYISDPSYQKEIDRLSAKLDALLASNEQPPVNPIESSSGDLRRLSNLQEQLALLNRKLQSFQTKDSVQVEFVNEDLKNQVVALQSKISVLSEKLDSVQVASGINDRVIRLGETSELPVSVLAQLREKELLKEEDGVTYLVPNENVLPIIYEQRGAEKGQKVLVLLPLGADEEDALVLDHKNADEDESGILPVKLQRDLERHYRNGVGIKFAPVIGANRPMFKEGESDITFGYGGSLDFIVSPSLSLETGVHYLTMQFETENPENFDKVNQPQIDPSVGDLTLIDIETEMLELPVNLKYRHPIKGGAVFASAGASAIFYTSQVYNYSHQIEVDNRPLKVESGVNLKPSSSPFSYLNFDIGMTQVVKKQNALELRLQYKHPLDELGETGISPSILGIKTAYWFKLR